jgi:hypothetical protein
MKAAVLSPMSNPMFEKDALRRKHRCGPKFHVTRLLCQRFGT